MASVFENREQYPTIGKVPQVLNFYPSNQEVKALGLRPRAFISFLVFETPMKHSHSFLKYYVKYEA